ncbi:phage tail length tape measure family protein [Pseudomonas plecoglossicida]|uniref:phage tail length tape measure family protein n=1 Tax=Pseudomonas TaxID=286 RepID=UPI000761ED98|nr:MULTISPECIES: phage tail length tape measure family protein [Pseudomonas]MDQ7965197.1 phage tail length tape measure family protein [Pseudomonas plecoglossicida]WBM44574.1 phage tail length tape measure family protein [Pseudomonas putida]WFG00998.1 phage tail length tape measure family protein [Pseudomonas putida]
MTQESRLAVTIDSRGAKRNADDLAESLKDVERAGEGATKSTEGLSAGLDEQRRELSQLLGQINPTVGALGRLDDMQEKLAKFKGSKFLDADTFDEYNQRINTMRDALGQTSEGLNRAGMSAKAYSASLRNVPAQFTDIVVSLEAGQAPLQVLLQQGGQLKDMFGGVGPAAKALGGYVLGLVNPFTVAAAAAGTLALAYYKGSEESDRLTDAIIRNGNAAGTSYSELSGLADQVAATGTTVGAASKVLEQLAGAGNALTPMYAQITKASLAWSKQTGEDVTKVVQSFNEIAKGPVEAVKKLDAELNFLTASQYANIISLEKQGKTIDAARAATDLYATALSSRSAEMESNLGSLESAWQSLGSFAKKAWDAMLDVGRKTTPEQELADVYNQIAEARKSISKYGSAASSLMGVNPDSLKALEKRATELQGRIADEAWKAWEGNTNRFVQDAGKKGVDLINSTFTAAQTQTQKLQKQLEDLDKARADAMAAGGFNSEQETKYATARKNIEQEIADIKAREAKKNAPKNVNRGVAEAENTFARLYGQYDPAAQAARALTKEQGQLDLALTKGKITQEEYSKALAQASINYAAALKGAQGLTAVEQYRAQLQRQLVNEQAQYQLDAASVGMGDLQTSRMQQRLNLEMQTNDRLLQLQTELANATDEKQRQALQGQIDAINEFLPQQLAAMQAGWAQMDQAMLNPINGWTAAVQNFGNQARDIAGQTEYIFSSAFNNISTDITDAIMSGQLSFSNLGDIAGNVVRDILAGFVKMGVQMALNAALNATLGTAAASQSMILAGTTATAWAPAAAMASLATLGANSVPAAAALTSTTALASSLAVIPGFATGGYVSGAGTGTSDSIMARLSDGEFVVNAAATKRNRALLEAINSNERISVAGGSGSVVSTQSSAQSGGGQTNQVIHQVTIENYSQSQVETRTDPDGRLRVLVQAVKEQIADEFAAGYGPVVDAGEAAYGWKRNPY